MSEHYIVTVPYGTKVEIKYEERRDPNREMHQYKTSRDPRIRALERRNLIAGVKYWAPMKPERRVGYVDRRWNEVAAMEYPPDMGRRFGLRDRRKS